MWLAGCCTTLLLSARRAFGSQIFVQASASGQQLQRALDSVDPSGPPQVHLTFPPQLSGAQGGRPELASLMVLDSSFNPPTRAHMHLLTSCMQRFGAARALLLLAKQNADKAVVGASLVQRLQMMGMLANADDSGRTCCGLTAHPLFVDKAAALQALCAPGARVHMLVGFDTWIRITDPKYYGEGQMLAVLSRLFTAVDVVVASRDPAAAGNMPPLSTAEQELAVLSLPAAVMRGRLHFVETDAEVAQMSSSDVREALRALALEAGGEGEAEGQGRDGRDASRSVLVTALPACLWDFVQAEGLYRD